MFIFNLHLYFIEFYCFRYISSQFLSLKVQPRFLLVSLISCLGFSLFVFSNFKTRGFNAVYRFIIDGPSSIAGDIGVQIKMTGLLYTIASVCEMSPFWHFPNLSFTARPQFIEYYRYIFSFFGIYNPPFIPNIYSSFGQYSICYGLVGTFSLLVILYLAFITGRRAIQCNQDSRRFYFLFILMLLFAFIKVNAANPAAWIMLASFFVISSPLALKSRI